MQWDSSTKIVPNLLDAFVPFALTPEVSHFPDPSDVPVLQRIVTRRVLVKAPNAHRFGLHGAPSPSSEPAQDPTACNVKNPHFDKEAYQCGSVMCTNIRKT